MTNKYMGMPKPQEAIISKRIALDPDSIAGYILLLGILLSISLAVIGLAWHFAVEGNLWVNYTIVGVNFAGFLQSIIRDLVSGPLRPELLISSSIAVLMMTPYVRLLFSLFYFAIIDSNWKYAILTSICLFILTYSLFAD